MLQSHSRTHAETHQHNKTVKASSKVRTPCASRRRALHSRATTPPARYILIPQRATVKKKHKRHTHHVVGGKPRLHKTKSTRALGQPTGPYLKRLPVSKTPEAPHTRPRPESHFSHEMNMARAKHQRLRNVNAKHQGTKNQHTKTTTNTPQATPPPPPTHQHQPQHKSKHNNPNQRAQQQHTNHFTLQPPSPPTPKGRR